MATPDPGWSNLVIPMSAPLRDATGVELLDLEYDVACVGAAEASAAEENQAAFFLVFYRLPENG